TPSTRPISSSAPASNLYISPICGPASTTRYARWGVAGRAAGFTTTVEATFRKRRESSATALHSIIPIGPSASGHDMHAQRHRHARRRQAGGGGAGLVAQAAPQDVLAFARARGR